MKIQYILIGLILFLYSCASVTQNNKEIFEASLIEFAFNKEDTLRINFLNNKEIVSGGLGRNESIDGHSSLSDGLKKRIEYVSAYLYENKNIKLFIESHERNIVEANQVSKNRARSILCVLVLFNDIEGFRTNMRFFGADKLLKGIDENSLEQRRIDLFFVKIKK